MWSLQSPRETAGKLSAGLTASGAARRRRAGAFFGADALAEAVKEKLRGGGREEKRRPDGLFCPNRSRRPCGGETR